MEETSHLPDGVVSLDNYRVIAIPGEGVHIVDETGNCWHVGGPHPDADADRNKLVRDYRNAIQ